MAAAIALLGLVVAVFFILRWAFGVVQRRREAHYQALKTLAERRGFSAYANPDHHSLGGLKWTAPSWFGGTHKGIRVHLRMRRQAGHEVDREWTEVIAEIDFALPDGLLVTRPGVLAHTGSHGPQVDVGEKKLAVSGHDTQAVEALLRQPRIRAACLALTNPKLTGRKSPGEGELRDGQAILTQPLTVDGAGLNHCIETAVELVLALSEAQAERLRQRQG